MSEQDANGARKSRELFLRIDVDFMLNDPRCVLMTDRQFRVYCQVSALALKERRELLPSRFDLRSTAFLLHTTAEQLHPTVMQLCGGPDPMLAIERNRLRVAGLKERYDGRFRWADDDVKDGAATAWQLHATTGAVGDNCDATAAEVEVEVDADGEPEREQEGDVDGEPLDVEDARASSPLLEPDAAELPGDAPDEAGEIHEPATTTATAGNAHPSIHDNGNDYDKGAADKDLDCMHGELAAIMERWWSAAAKGQSAFRMWRPLMERVANPGSVFHVLSHVLEVDATSKMRSKAAALYTRLFPKSEEEELRPAEWAQKAAAKRLNQDLEVLSAQLPEADQIGRLADAMAPGIARRKVT
jgi:hypothetical protein